MDKLDRIKQVVAEFQNEKLVKKYLYEHEWLSGSSTVVHPITIWADEVVIQWKSNKNVFEKFIKRIVNKYNDVFEYGYFWKSDGSCPSKLVFCFNDEYKSN